MIKLYDSELSGSCYKVRLLLHILKVSYETIAVDFISKEQKTPKFARLNPFGELPVLEDGDLRLRDAQAIMIYLARKYDKSNTWFPDAAGPMGEIAQWLSTGGNEIMNAAGARLVKLLNYPLDLARLQARAHAVFQIMDDHLADREFLALGYPTIGDIACFPYTALAGEGDISLKPYSNILRWIDRMKGIPGFISMPGIPAIQAMV
ncbi:glutathione S-transferase [Dongia soli]|uniref:Glutathione S-transferase n=1 Tax=Dongia soli TaxID=600628 RepID=A0ABU5EHX0_9PROT|nr:glutathione S-transferase [Dongia soli]MDY0885818.1 glutathione S-transferase [Dongia soli]